MIVVGIVLAVLAAAIGTTSKQLIAASEHLKKPWLFHLGASMNIAVGPVVDASAYAFAPQVIVAPFACLDVIFNAVTAPYTLHWQQERLTPRHLIGTAFVSLGAIFTSVFAAADNIIYSVQELEAQLFFRPTSVCYMLVELSAILTVNLLLQKRLLNNSVRGISLGVVAGVLMGNVFFMKGLIGIIQTTVSTGDFGAWLRPTPYILAVCAGGGAVTGHVFMRKGLGEYKGVFMVTIFEGAHISAACLSGCVVMEEMAGAPWWRYVLYWLSVSMIVVGLLVMNMAAFDAQIEGKFHIAQSFRNGDPNDEVNNGKNRNHSIAEDEACIQNEDAVYQNARMNDDTTWRFDSPKNRGQTSWPPNSPPIGRPFEERDVERGGAVELRNIAPDDGDFAHSSLGRERRTHAPGGSPSTGW